MTDQTSTLDRLRQERQSLIERNVPGKPGVTDIRARLKAITHEIMRIEAEEGE